jgi:tetratricopeptide (TPR) repeat protein
LWKWGGRGSYARLLLILVTILLAGGCSQLKVQQSARYVKIQTSPSYIRASHYERALLLYEQGFLAKARKQALKVGEEESRYQEARNLLKKIDRLSFWLSSVHIEMGKLYEQAGVFGAAIDEFTAALRLNPKNKKIEKRLDALKAGDLSYIEEERAAFLKVQREKEERVREAERRRERAKREAAQEKAKATPEALAFEHYRRGMAHLDVDKLAMAIEEFEAVTRVLPSYRDAGALLDETRKRRDREVVIYLMKGISYFQEEEMEKAIEAWDMVLELDPGNETALDYKARAERVMSRLLEIREGGE